ncbi:MAG: hypothetical protein KGL39_27405 [Patescibacteria group bacterium]|nr:hypothetical protein [Patescibacteria group bacterium]
MSTTYTTNLKLQEPADGDTQWGDTLNATISLLDAQNAIGDMAVTLHETPSASLDVDVSSGAYVKTDGTIGSYAGAVSVAVTTAATNYLYLDSTGALQQNTTGFPTNAAVYPLATVVAGASTITSITDSRVVFTAVGSPSLPLAGGTLTDGANIALGSTTGTKLGTASTQKLGFFGATPVVQPTVGAATAGSSYTATEQAMLQAVYDAVRTLGLGS